MKLGYESPIQLEESEYPTCKLIRSGLGIFKLIHGLHLCILTIIKNEMIISLSRHAVTINTTSVVVHET